MPDPLPLRARARTGARRSTARLSADRFPLGQVAAVGAAVVLLVVLVVALGGGGGSAPPANASARLVPADALVFVHLSTDSGRDAVARAGALANRFPDYPSLRDSILRRLSASPGSVDLRRDVTPWLGPEAALALLNTGGTTAGSLVLVAVRDQARARAFLARSSTPAPSSRYGGVEIQRFGAVQTAFVGGFMVIGQDATVRAAIDLHAGRGRSLAQEPTYRSAVAPLPADRVLDGYVTAGGVRRVLAPQGGLLGAVGTLLNGPALLGSAFALSAADHGARMVVHSVLSPSLERLAPPRFRPFEPSLQGNVPSNALAYLGVAGLDSALGRLLGAAGQSSGGLGLLLSRARAALGNGSSPQLAADLKTLFGREVAVWIAAHLPAPTLALVARAPDEARVRLDLARLQGPLALAFSNSAAKSGQVPVFQQARVQGVDAFSLRLAPGTELDYAVFNHKLVIATNLEGISAALRVGHPLVDTTSFKQVLGRHPGTVGSLVFLDFSQLLQLAEQTGLSASPTYSRLRADLQMIRAVGESSTGGQSQTTAELFLSIP